MGRRREESTEPEIELLEKEYQEKAPGVGFTKEQLDLLHATKFKVIILREKPAKAYWDNKEKARDRERIRQEQKAGKKKAPQPSKEVARAKKDPPAKLASKQSHDTVSSVKTPARSKITTTTEKAYFATTEKKTVAFAPTTPINLKSRDLLSAMNSVPEEEPSKVCQDKSHSEEGQYSPGSIKVILELTEEQRDALCVCKELGIKVVNGQFSPGTQALIQLSEKERSDVIKLKAYDTTDLTAFGAEMARSNHKADEDFQIAQSAANQALIKSKDDMNEKLHLLHSAAKQEILQADSDMNEKLYLAHSATKEKNNAIFDATMDASFRRLDVLDTFLKKHDKSEQPELKFGCA